MSDPVVIDRKALARWRKRNVPAYRQVEAFCLLVLEWDVVAGLWLCRDKEPIQTAGKEWG